jgi:hypothetical protein
VHAQGACSEHTTLSVAQPVRVVCLANLTWRADR